MFFEPIGVDQARERIGRIVNDCANEGFFFTHRLWLLEAEKRGDYVYTVIQRKIKQKK